MRGNTRTHLMLNPIKVTKEDLPLQRFYRWEKERADKIFLTQPMGAGVVRDITWAEAGNEVRRMASWLQAQGWPAGSTVAILGKNSAHWLLADLAIWMAGFVSVPIYPTFNADALRYILQHSEARACFVGKLDDTASLKDGVPAAVPLITLPLAPAAIQATSWDQLIAASQALPGQPVRDGEGLCTIIYTSGTTGRPKGVRLLHRSWTYEAAATAAMNIIDENDLQYLWLPLAHSLGKVLLTLPMEVGCCTAIDGRIDKIVDNLAVVQPTFMGAAPRIFEKAYGKVIERSRGSSLRTADDFANLSRVLVERGDVAASRKVAAEMKRELRGDKQAELAALVTESLCLHAEGAGMAKGLQHPLSLGIHGRRQSILTLVTKPPGLLPFRNVDGKLRLALMDRHRRRTVAAEKSFRER